MSLQTFENDVNYCMDTHGVARNVAERFVSMARGLAGPPAPEPALKAPPIKPSAASPIITEQDVAEEYKEAIRELDTYVDKPEPLEMVIKLIESAQDDQIRSTLIKSGMTETEAVEFEKTARAEFIDRSNSEVDDLRATAMAKADEAIAAKYERDRLYVENFCLRNKRKFPQTKEEVERFAKIFRKQELDALDARERSKKKQNEYSLSLVEYAEEMTKEYPVIPLVYQTGPSWDDSILYGKAGELTRKVCQYNEAHPVGVMVDFLVSLGSLFGPNPHFVINATKHHTNEFIARIGETSRGRKGSGRDAIDEILKLIDADWYRDKVMSGFGSGQSIVNEIRDTSTTTITDTRKGTSKEVVVPGIADKRLFIREGELAGVFILADQEGSTASTILRDGWDSKPLRNKVKGKSANGISNSAVCMCPHMSISGDITSGELKKTMPEGADKNGFANRFLYLYTYRVKLCPLGGPPLNLSDEIVYFYEAVQFAQKQGLVPLSSGARKLWGKLYMKLEEDQTDGIVGAMTARAAAHIRRLATIIALVEKSAIVEVEHLRAAEALWDYCYDSVKYVFTKMTRDQERILSWIERESTSGKTITLRRVREELYGKNKLAEWVRNHVEQLVQQGKVTMTDQVITLVKIA